MPAYATKPALRTIDLSPHGGPTDAKVVVIPLPAKTIGIVFGQRTAEWVQRYNTYVLDVNYFVKDPQALWLAPGDNSRFDIVEIKPPGFDKDPAVLSIGPFNDDNYIAVYTSHLKPGEKNFVPSDPHHSSYDFTIGGKNAISFTLVNAEDGGDSDYHDTVVGVAVNYTYK